MIVQQDGPPVDVSKTSFAPASSRPTDSGRSGEMPPAYSNYPAGPSLPYATPFDQYHLAIQRAKRRFWKSLFVGILVWFLISMLASSIADLTHVSRHRGHWGDVGGIARDWPEFSSGEVKECLNRADWLSQQDIVVEIPDIEISLPDMEQPISSPPYHSDMTFTLPVNTDLLYFLSRGSLAYGSVKIDTKPDGGDDVRVDVRVSYWSRSALERATVCKLETDGKNGLGIFTPRSWPRGRMQDMLRFDVAIYLPVSGLAPSRRLIKALQTDFSNFGHELGDIQNFISFDSLSLSTSNGRIDSKGVYAESGVLKTSNGGISGVYNSSTSLRLTTSNARIETEVTLNSGNKATELVMKTSNGVINSAINLRNSSHGAESAFTVVSTTSNAALDIYFPAQPLSSFLSVDAKTSNGKVSVALNPAYEGTFTLRTSNARATVDRGEVQDPSGEGRPRNVEYNMALKSPVTGKVWWGEWVNKKSWVHVQSSNAPVNLKLREV